MKIAEYDIWDYLSKGCGEVDLYLLYEEAALSPAPDLTPPPLFIFLFFFWFNVCGDFTRRILIDRGAAHPQLG